MEAKHILADAYLRDYLRKKFKETCILDGKQFSVKWFLSTAHGLYM